MMRMALPTLREGLRSRGTQDARPVPLRQRDPGCYRRDQNPLTGQTVANAKKQYRTDREPKNLTLRRALVHFAVDTEQVFMTTRLAGESTAFLPFNRGDGLAAGNPPNPHGHRTAYLWEQVWRRDVWLAILQRFIHIEFDHDELRGVESPELRLC